MMKVMAGFKNMNTMLRLGVGQCHCTGVVAVVPSNQAPGTAGGDLFIVVRKRSGTKG